MRYRYFMLAVSWERGSPFVVKSLRHANERRPISLKCLFWVTLFALNLRMLLPLLASLLLGAPVDNVINAIDTGVIDLHGASKAQVLVIVADHGSGTSTFGEALNKHPCLFDVGEPFGDSYLVWTSSKIPECHGTTPEATFDADSHHLLHESNAKLSTHLANVVKHLGVSHIDSGELYHGLHYDLSEFFVRIRDLVCKDVPANVCPAADCAIALKMFPQVRAP